MLIQINIIFSRDLISAHHFFLWNVISYFCILLLQITCTFYKLHTLCLKSNPEFFVRLLSVSTLYEKQALHIASASNVIMCAFLNNTNEILPSHAMMKLHHLMSKLT